METFGLGFFLCEAFLEALEFWVELLPSWS